MNEEASHQSHAMRWTVGVLTALLLYVLSYGPVYALIQRGTILQHKWLKDFYEPMHWLRDNTALRQPIKRYGKWWIDLLKKP